MWVSETPVMAVMRNNSIQGVEKTQFDHTSLLKYMIQKWGLDPLGRRTAAANSISVAIGDERRDDTPSFIRVSYSDLVPPDPGLEREDSSNHHKALQAFAYHLAKETGNLAVVQRAMQKPSGWIRAKAALGRLMLSTGAKLTSDLQRFNGQKVDDTMHVVDSMIAGIKRA